MKRCNERIRVESDTRGVPLRFAWRKRSYNVLQIEEQWRSAGQWWLDGKGWRRRYYRVTTRNSSAAAQKSMQIYEQAGHWVLAGLLD